MKVLFICKSNVLRSQMAAALFEKYTSESAHSAGINVGHIGQALRDVSDTARTMLNVLKEGEGIDIAHNTRVQLTLEMITDYDRVIVLADQSAVPEYVREAEHVAFWDTDQSKEIDEFGFHTMVSEIKNHIQALVREYSPEFKIC